MNPGQKLPKKITVLILIYFLIGLFFGFSGEMRLAKKYGVTYGEALKDPWVYIRAVAISPFWPMELVLNIWHCQNLLGCPAETIY